MCKEQINYFASTIKITLKLQIIYVCVCAYICAYDFTTCQHTCDKYNQEYNMLLYIYNYTCGIYELRVIVGGFVVRVIYEMRNDESGQFTLSYISSDTTREREREWKWAWGHVRLPRPYIPAVASTTVYMANCRTQLRPSWLHVSWWCSREFPHPVAIVCANSSHTQWRYMRA